MWTLPWCCDGRWSVLRMFSTPGSVWTRIDRCAVLMGGGGGGGGLTGVTSGQVLSVLMKSSVFHRFFFNISTSLTCVYKTLVVVLQHGTTVRLQGGRAAYPYCWPAVWTREHLGFECFYASRLVSGPREAIGEPIATAQYAALALRTTAGEALVPITIVPLLSLTPIVIPLPHTPNIVGPEIVPLSLVGHPQPAWLGDLPGTCPCHPDAVLLRTRRSDHHGAVVRPLALGGCPLIAAAITPPLGHLLLDLAGDRVPVLAVHAPCLLTGIVNDVCTRRTNVFSGFVTFLLCLNRMRTWMLTRIHQLMIPGYWQR